LSYLPLPCFHRERRDQEHASQIEKRMKEEEDIRAALRMQDEMMAKKLHKQETSK